MSRIHALAMSRSRICTWIYKLRILVAKRIFRKTIFLNRIIQSNSKSVNFNDETAEECLYQSQNSQSFKELDYYDN